MHDPFWCCQCLGLGIIVSVYGFWAWEVFRTQHDNSIDQTKEKLNENK